MDLKNRKPGSEQITWGITALTVIIISITFYFLFDKFASVKEAVESLLGILNPIILGLMIAYVLVPVYNSVERQLEPRLEQKFRTPGRGRKTARLLSTAISVTLALLTIIILFSMIIPQVFQSVYNIWESMPQKMTSLSATLGELLADYPEAETFVNNAIKELWSNLQKWMGTDLIPGMSNILSGITVGVMSVVTFLLNFVVGFIICIYVLNSKEQIAAGTKKVLYSTLSTDKANWVVETARLFHKVFGGFLTGKIIDSTIIGIICFIAMTIIGLPYSVMISVIIGVTNIIPFFGPFLGAIPASIIILLDGSLAQAVYFVILILILQQLDGNIIGPRIIGESTGLSGFWVMFAILVGGGLFGFLGMILGVPVFAVIYELLKECQKKRLSRFGLPVETDDYKDMAYIDKETRQPVYFEKTIPVKREEKKDETVEDEPYTEESSSFGGSTTVLTPEMPETTDYNESVTVKETEKTITFIKRGNDND